MLNKNEFNLQLDDIETKAIANFSAALIKAFEMLSQFKADGLGAQCNQVYISFNQILSTPNNYIFS